MVQKQTNYKKTLYYSFLNVFIKKGKKQKAKKLIDNTFFQLCKSFSISSIKILFTIYYKLDYFIEIKQVKIKRRVHVVPFSIIYERRIYLILKKVIGSINMDKRKVCLSEKLRTEIYYLIK